MNKSIIQCFLVVLIFGISSFQEKIKNPFLGEWKTKEVISNTDEIPVIKFGKKDSPQEEHIELKSNGAGFNFVTGENFEYEIGESELRLGIKWYKVESISNSELILIERNENIGLNNTKYVFEKIIKGES